MTSIGTATTAARRPRTWIVAAATLLVACLAPAATGQLRVVNYNIAQLQGDLGDLEAVLVGLHDDDKPGFAVPVTIFTFQEVRSTDFATLQGIVNAAAPPGVSYTAATYTSGGLEDSSAGAQAMFYDSSRLFEVVGEHLDLPTGANRATDRWTLDLIGYDDPVVRIYVYSSHLKAGPSGSDADDRLAGVQTIRADADTLPAGSHIIYTGDMNFYGAGEAGYLEFFLPGVGQALDPLGSGAWNGAGNAIKHTQSPTLSGGGGLIGGGMNDRFDFQLGTTEWFDDDGLALIGGTYRAFGNDGMHFDQSITTGGNSYYPGDIPRSNALASALRDASDHIPVVAEYQVPAIFDVFIGPDFGRVIVGADFEHEFLILNSAPVSQAIGADVLDYTAIGSDGFLGMTTGSLPALAGVATESLPVDTSVAATVNGTISFLSLNEDVQHMFFDRFVSGTVVRPSNPSFDGGSDVDVLALDLSFDADTGVQPIDVDVHNLGFDALQALLDLDAANDATAPYGFAGGLATGIGATPATLSFTFDTTGLADGSYPATITIDTSDEDLPGETVAALTLEIDVVIGDAPPCPGDFDGTGAVDILDVLALLAAWDSSNPQFDIAPEGGDGTVNILDLLAVLAAWGPCP